MASAGTRGAALVVGCAVSSGLLSWLACPAGGTADLLSRSPEQSLPLLLCLVMSAVTAWVAVLMAIGAAARLPGSTGRLAGSAFRHLAPAVLRRGVEVLLGATTLLAVTSGAAQAAPATPRPAAAAGHLVVGLDRPAAPATAIPAPVLDLDRPAADPARGIGLVTAVPSRSAVHQAISPAVTVRPGDSLWRIAERSLPPGAGQDAIERAWHSWYRVNRAVIGSNPDLLLPGQQLVPPTS
jgi:hypothetical protein